MALIYSATNSESRTSGDNSSNSESDFNFNIFPSNNKELNSKTYETFTEFGTLQENHAAISEAEIQTLSPIIFGTIYSSLEHLNLSVLPQLPLEYTEISPVAWSWIITYCIVFILASVGNLLEFFAVWRRIRIRCTPMNMLLMNLCVADLLVSGFVILLEIGWRISIGWYAGRVMCKFLQFCRAFSLYLSSLVLICLTLDRYYAVLYPLKVVNASTRVKWLLIMAWTFAILLAMPQCFVFDVKSHPRYPSFTQCTTEGDITEEANTILSICFMYFLPFLVILFSYGNIIYRLTVENESSTSPQNSSTDFRLRRSDKTLMDRAKIRALKLTFTIVSLFIFCWTPYILMTTWHVVHRTSAEMVHPNIQEALFIMVVANSCTNPLVYGVFHCCGENQGRNSRGPTPSATMTTHSRKSTWRNKIKMEINPENRKVSSKKSTTQSPSPPLLVQKVECASVLANQSGQGCSRFLSRSRIPCPIIAMTDVEVNVVTNFAQDVGINRRNDKIESTSI